MKKTFLIFILLILMTAFTAYADLSTIRASVIGELYPVSDTRMNDSMDETKYYSGSDMGDYISSCTAIPNNPSYKSGCLNINSASNRLASAGTGYYKTEPLCIEVIANRTDNNAIEHQVWETYYDNSQRFFWGLGSASGTNFWNLMVSDGSPTVATPSRTSITDRNLHQEVVCFDGTNVYSYSDGVKIDTEPFAKSIIDVTDATSYISLRTYDGNPVGTTQFEGGLARLTFFAMNLSESDVAELYNSGSFQCVANCTTPPAPSLPYDIVHNFRHNPATGQIEDTLTSTKLITTGQQYISYNCTNIPNESSNQCIHLDGQDNPKNIFQATDLFHEYSTGCLEIVAGMDAMTGFAPLFNDIYDFPANRIFFGVCSDAVEGEGQCYPYSYWGRDYVSSDYGDLYYETGYVTDNGQLRQYMYCWDDIDPHLYIDGAEVSLLSNSNKYWFNDLPTGSVFKLMNNFGGGWVNWIGDFAYMRYYNKNLTSDDVSAIYNAGDFTCVVNCTEVAPPVTCSVCNETCSPCGGGCTATDLTNMYYGVTGFDATYGDITGWNTSCITNMEGLFRDSDFNQDISGWDTSSVTTFREMFSGDTSFNQPIGSWDTSSAIEILGIFNGASSFNQNINSWDISDVTDLGTIFAGASSFNQPLNSWNTSSVTSMYKTFSNAVSFNQPLNNWDMSGVTYTRSMFQGATSFNQNLASWDVSSITNAIGMFNSVPLSISNYDAILNGWSSQSVQSGVTFQANIAQYSTSGLVGRNILTGTYSWYITDGGLGVLPCTEDWLPEYSPCNVSDEQVLTYYDNNSCGTFEDLPVNNGTTESCNYCTIGYNEVSYDCVEGESQKQISYEYTNYETCCALTSIPADCDLPANHTTSCIGIHMSSDIPAVVIDGMVTLGQEFIKYAPIIAIITLVIIVGVYIK